ncbi:F-box protein [Platanthera zijinensis]|uniref:F-box protein n=1 Tax=Platanthera zijinensis TaxID=2320716 RepID=A0AAP0BAG0_9ASPA
MQTQNRSPFSYESFSPSTESNSGARFPSTENSKIVVGEEMPEKHQCMGSQSRLYLPEHLVVEILLRLPAKSVGRFRCVSTAWLSISIDPSFIVSHTRRIPKSLVLPFIPLNHLHRNELFNVSIGIDTRGLCLNTDVPLSSCDGLVSFRGFNSEGPCANYVMNPLTGLRIDLPSPSANAEGQYSWMRELYYHRWTSEYRLLNVYSWPRFAEVLSLGSAMDSWRRIDAAPPLHVWILWDKCVVVNDCLYWLCGSHNFQAKGVVVIFDVLEEVFSFMDLPYDIKYRRENYGLVKIEGKLGCWMASKDNKNVGIDGYQINIWVEAKGDEKWGSAYSLDLCGEEWRRLIYPSPYALILFAFFSSGLILFLVNGSDMLYLLHWDLQSGNYSAKQLSNQPITGLDRILIHKQTLIDMPTITQHV